jgi:hypothetical protein
MRKTLSNTDSGHFITGFIGLVIGLGVLAIITSVAAFILIRRRSRSQGKAGDMFGGFPKPGMGIFGRKKSKGWMQTHSYTDHDDIHLGPKGGHSNTYNEPTGVGAPNAGKLYDDPFNAESLDNLQRETSARIDHGPEYHPVATGGDPDPNHPSTSPTVLTGGTKFKEGL